MMWPIHVFRQGGRVAVHLGPHDDQMRSHPAAAADPPADSAASARLRCRAHVCPQRLERHASHGLALVEPLCAAQQRHDDAVDDAGVHRQVPGCRRTCYGLDINLDFFFLFFFFFLGRFLRTCQLCATTNAP